MKLSWKAEQTPAQAAAKPARTAKPVQAAAKPAGHGFLDRTWKVTRITGNSVYSFCRYLLSLKWIVDIVRWMINRGGYIAESAFILATVYVTVNTVAHKLVSWVMTDDQIRGANQLAVICFSVLPELIIFAALSVTFHHWRIAFLLRRDWQRNLDKWAWALAYTAPTSVFLFMTIATICTFVSVESVNPNAVTIIATGNALVARCLSGWFFGVVQMLYEQVGKPGHSSTIATLKAQIDHEKDTVTKRDATVKTLQEQQSTLQEQLAQVQKELTDVRLAQAAKKASRNKSTNDTVPGKSDSVPRKSDTVPGNVSNATHHKLKKHLHTIITRGEKINYKAIAAELSIYYGTVRKLGPGIIKELQQEQQQGQQARTEQNTEQLETISV